MAFEESVIKERARHQTYQNILFLDNRPRWTVKLKQTKLFAFIETD
jgi:hypothetical protein